MTESKKEWWSFSRLAGLSIGLALGLALAYMAASLRGRLVGPAAGPRFQLIERSIGAVGPIELNWSTEELTPIPSAFIIDDRISVELNAADDSLLIVPDQPLTPGQHSLSYQPVAGQARQWEFQVRQPEPLYLMEAAGQRSLYRWRDGDPLLLSGEQLVIDYAPAQQGDLIAFSASGAEAGNDIWLIDRQGQDLRQLVDCGSDRCGQLDWSPKGDRLAFSRRAAAEPGQPRLWTVAIENGAASPLFQDEERLGEDPNWSPDGRFLAFYDPAVNGVRILDIDTVREEVIPNRTGISGSWSSDSQRLYLPLLVFQGEEPVTHLYQLELEQRALSQILGEAGGWRQVGEPALGLDGPWMALSASAGSTGDSLGLFLVDLQDNTVRALAEDLSYSFGGPSFDATGQQLLFQRFPVGQNQAAPDVLLWQVDQAEASILIEGAGSADWLH